MALRAKGKASSFAVGVILLLLIVGLAGFGVSGFGGQIRTIGSVGETEIPVDRYARALQQEFRMFEAQTGQRFTMAQAQTFGLDRAVLQQVVASAALENEAARLGLSVGDEAVRREVLRVPAFQSLSGQFDRAAYEATLRQNGQTVGEFESTVRTDTARTLLQGAIVAGVQTPQAFTDTLFAYARESRDFTFLTLTAADLETPLPEPDEETLRAYYDAHPETFTLPARRRITYAWLTPSMIVDDVPVDEEALRALYEERSEEYRQPERRLVERLTFGTTEEAAAAREAIDAGETTFDDLVSERGLGPADVDLGDVSREELGGAADELFALSEPGIAGPLDSDLGPSLFRVNGILAAQETSFEDARPQLLAEFADGTARREVAAQIDPVEDLLAGGATLEEVAEQTPLDLGEVLLAEASDEPIAGYLDFRQAADAAEVGDFPEVIQLDDGGIVALRLDEVVAPALQPFENVEVAVIDAWETEATAQALVAQAEAIASSLEGGEPMPGDPVTRTTVARDAFIEGAPDQLVTEVFAMSEGETRVVQGEASALVVRLDAVNAPDPEAPEAVSVRERLADQTAQAYAQDMIDAFTLAIEAQAGIQLNQTAINAVHAQFP